jgi:hypothetical protein
MNGSIQYLGRGLLVLALCGWAVGCGDDDDSGGSDSGVDGGGGGSGGNGGGGTGGKGEKDAGGGTGGGGTGGSGGTVTMAQCVSMTNTNTGGMAADACVTCVCDKDIEATVACNSNCWSLISCVGAKCGGSATSAGCLTDANKCGDEFSAASADGDAVSSATALGMVITMSCSTECVASSGTDGGAEDGGT